MGRYSWSRSNSHELRRFAEYFVTREFALDGLGVDSPQADDRWIDLVARHGKTRLAVSSSELTGGIAAA